MIGGKPARKDLAHAGLAAQKAAYEFGKLAAAAITRDLDSLSQVWAEKS